MHYPLFIYSQMDIQNCSTPPKHSRLDTPERPQQNDFSTPTKKTFETPRRQQPNCQQDSSSRRPMGKRSNLISTNSKLKENPESKQRRQERQRVEAQNQEDREEFEVSMFSLSRLQQDYQLVRALGAGNFSEVGLFQSRLSQELFAIKQTRANRMSINEVQALGALWALVEQSPNVIRYFHSWIEEGLLFLVMEYCEDSLSKLIDRHRIQHRPFQEKTIKRVLRGALMGLHCLHRCGILHLDLKPQNMLLQGETLKIADFGLSRAARVRSGDVEEGDSRYLAREVLNYSPLVDLTKADIFSLAMTIFEMLTLQRLPNNGPEWMRVREHGLQVADRMDLTGYSQDLLHLIEKMGAKEWSSRPSAQECLQAPCLKESLRVNQLLAANTRSSKKRERDGSL